jgi:hypothetical protein
MSRTRYSLLSTATIAALSLSLLAAGGCGSGGGDIPVIPQTTTSAAETVYNGRAVSFVTLGGGGVPMRVGVRIDASVLPSLPTVAPAASRHAGHAGDDHSATGLTQQAPPQGSSTIIPIPQTANLPFNHITLDWNPAGHPPPGIYDPPHFDIHFYMISQAEQEAIVGPNLALADKPLPAGSVPPGFVSQPGTAVPMMGAHYINVAGPEFRGQPFTHTFIYGAYNGQVTFFEPMITKAFLESRQNISVAIPQPQQYPKPGYYPMTYTVQHLPDGSTEIALENFVLR